MKHFLISVITLFYCLSCSEKITNIDLLITKINNQQVGMSHHFIRLPEMKSSAADSLIQIGKSATLKLIAVLDDTSKGIIANYILSDIWYNERRVKIGADSLLTRSNQDEGKGMVNIINGLKYYYTDELGSYAEKSELERNKKEWQEFIKKTPHKNY